MKPFVITSLVTSRQLNQYWQRQFPFLKLQIYSLADRLLEGDEIDHPLSKLYPNHGDLRWLAVNPDSSVNTFEIAFHYTFGLRVEGLRKSGYTWDELDYTKSWTLKEHNLKGNELSMGYKLEAC